MKYLTKKLTLAAAIALAFGGGITESQATKVTLDGSGFYKTGLREFYFKRAPKQTGRYRKLGADYYHKGRFGMDQISNDTTRNSGTLSFEFWAMNYYQASSGIILMTRKLHPLNAGYYYPNKEKRGYALSINRSRYPELSLWEYTRKGWKWRDALSFTRKTRL